MPKSTRFKGKNKNLRKSSRRGSITIHRQKYWRKPYTRKNG